MNTFSTLHDVYFSHLLERGNTKRCTRNIIANIVQNYKSHQIKQNHGMGMYADYTRNISLNNRRYDTLKLSQRYPRTIEFSQAVDEKFIRSLCKLEIRESQSRKNTEFMNTFIRQSWQIQTEKYRYTQTPKYAVNTNIRQAQTVTVGTVNYSS